MKNLTLIILVFFSQNLIFGQIDKSKYVLANTFDEEMRISEIPRDEFGRTFSGQLDEKYDIILKVITIDNINKTASFSYEILGSTNYTDNIKVNETFIIPRGNQNFFVECKLKEIIEKSDKYKVSTATINIQIFRDREVLAKNNLVVNKISNYYYFNYFNKKKQKKEINKKILVLKDSINKIDNILIFKTDLQVNTDGTPISYHPFDLKGEKFSINNIGNAATVKKKNSNENLFMTKYSEGIAAFEKFRDNNYEQLKDYDIVWDNVLIPERKNGKKKPCIIKTGEYKGYFSSATSLKNNLKTDKGECDCNNQVNPLKIPAFVLPKGENFMKEQGVKVGDLLVIYNPTTNKVVYGVINDEGPKEKLGEASVYMNMLLKNKTTLPKNKQDTYDLAIKENVYILIIPMSKEYKFSNEIFTKENIEKRTKSILSEKFSLLNENDLILLFNKFDL